MILLLSRRLLFCWSHPGLICPPLDVLCDKGLNREGARRATEGGGGFGFAMAGGPPEAQDHPAENGFTPLERPVPRLLPHIDGCVLPSLGGFGRHQKHLVILTWIPALFIGFSQFSDHFLLAQPNSTCLQPRGNASNWTGVLPPLASASGGGGAPASQFKGNDSGEEPPCSCKEWKLELQTGLRQNVVTKVTRDGRTEAPQPPRGEYILFAISLPITTQKSAAD